MASKRRKRAKRTPAERAASVERIAQRRVEQDLIDLRLRESELRANEEAPFFDDRMDLVDFKWTRALQDREIFGRNIPYYRQRGRDRAKYFYNAIAHLLKFRSSNHPSAQLVFIGRDGMLIHNAALQMARNRGFGISPKDIKLVNVSGPMIIKYLSNSFRARRLKDEPMKPERAELFRYLESVGIDMSRPMVFVDSGKHGATGKDLADLVHERFPRAETGQYVLYAPDEPNLASYDKKEPWDAKLIYDALETQDHPVEHTRDLRRSKSGRTVPDYVPKDYMARMRYHLFSAGLAEGIHEIMGKKGKEK